MNADRIKEIQSETAYPESLSVAQALMKVWNECAQEYGKPQEVTDKGVECEHPFKTLEINIDANRVICRKCNNLIIAW